MHYNIFRGQLGTTLSYIHNHQWCIYKILRLGTVIILPLFNAFLKNFHCCDKLFYNNSVQCEPQNLKHIN